MNAHDTKLFFTVSDWQSWLEVNGLCVNARSCTMHIGIEKRMMLLSVHYAVYQTRFDCIDPKNQRIKFFNGMLCVSLTHKCYALSK